ncbi:hypothetical protein JTB14_029828 [Gonioctena quinquepunctata]|nr:hypothetical protein JTB14_029828 [Gonioctena quinquepunctata]
MNFNKCDMEKVNESIFIESRTTIDENHIRAFNEKFTKAAHVHSPKTKYYAHELPLFIIKLLKNKRSIYREYKGTQEPELNINSYSKNIEK